MLMKYALFNYNLLLILIVGKLGEHHACPKDLPVLRAPPIG
jgi:hypothetical protein